MNSFRGKFCFYGCWNGWFCSAGLNRYQTGFLKANYHPAPLTTANVGLSLSVAFVSFHMIIVTTEVSGYTLIGGKNK